MGGFFDESTENPNPRDPGAPFGTPEFGGEWTPPEPQKDSTEPFEVEKDPFFPKEPDILEEAGLSTALVEHLILKTVHDNPGLTGNEVAANLCMNPTLVRSMLQGLKRRMLLVHAAGDAAGDFHFDLSRDGRQLAR